MSTLIKYLSSEAIENCALCLNYQFDNVIFFANENTKDEEQSNISSFLLNECNVKNVDYRIIDSKSVELLINSINEVLKTDTYFIDLTGCDGICHVAFNSVGLDKNIPLFLYDIRNLELYSLNKCDYGIEVVKQQTINMNIEKYIRMVGGIVRDNENNSISENVFNKLDAIKNKYEQIWKAFSCCMQKCNTYNEDNLLEANNDDVYSLSVLSKNEISCDQIFNILDDLNKNNLIKEYIHNDNGFNFKYIDEEIRKIILKTGTILEYETYFYEKKLASDCAVSINLDWDGIIEDNTNGDVKNEIDVLRLDNYELTFISCKDTKKIEKENLYELETVARKFGGKYSKMKLVCSGFVSDTDKKRAKLIGIEVINIKDLLNSNH